MDPSWKPILDQYDFQIDRLYESTIPIYPPKEQVFRVFEMPVQDIRIVLLGQDPYHGEGQAHGLSFSVPEGVATPPSLQNIFKELKRSFPERNYTFPNGDLTAWFQREKIFLFNASLTVLQGAAGSHMNLWKEFTDDVIKYIDEQNPNCVFLLLGNFAKAKAQIITKKDRIVTEVHPSPLARGFVGSDVFKRVEQVLGQEVNWSQNTVTEASIENNTDIVYLPCDPNILGKDKIAVNIAEDKPRPPQPPKPKKKLTRLERMCQDPQNMGEVAVQAYVEYCKAYNKPILVEEINDCLS